MSNVIQMMNVIPKTLNRKYKNHDYSVVFDVETKKWRWEVTYVEITKFVGDLKDTMTKAIRAAEKHIDRTLEIRG